MEPEAQRRSPDWPGATDDHGEEPLIQRLDDLVDWSGWLTICSAEREHTFGDLALHP